MFDFVESESKSLRVGSQSKINKDFESRLRNGIDFPTIPDFFCHL